MASTKISKDQANELLKANAHFAQHLYSYIIPMSLKCAVQLGIPDTIHSHGKPMTIHELATALPIHPRKVVFLPQLIRILTHSGYFSKHELPGGQDAYSLTTMAQFLLKDHPFTASPYILFVTSSMFMKSWIDLGSWFQNGNETPFHTAHGMSLWECTRAEEELNKNFNEGMAGDSRMVATVLFQNEDLSRALFGGVSSLVDVGGGIGEIARAIADAYPKMHCVVLDLPQVVEDLKGTANLKFVAGDMFVHVPSADAVMLKWVLHDWDDEDCVKILKLCRKAINSNRDNREPGKLIIIEIVLNDEDELDENYGLRQTQLFYDMQMMGIVAGKERSEKEWKKIFEDAGFAGGYKIHPVLGFRSIIEVYP